MKKQTNILILSGSPVEDSSTDIILNHINKTITQNLKDDTEVISSFYKLNDYNIKPCIACGESPEPDWCIYHDLDELYKKLAECDCLLFGSPVYFDSVSAQAKLFIDRINCFRPPDYDNKTEYQFRKRLTEKRPGAMVIAGGENSWYEGARRVIAGFFKWVEVTNDGYIAYSSDDFNHKGSVVNNKEKLVEAEQIGTKLSQLLRGENG